MGDVLVLEDELVVRDVVVVVGKAVQLVPFAFGDVYVALRQLHSSSAGKYHIPVQTVLLPHLSLHVLTET